MKLTSVIPQIVSSLICLPIIFLIVLLLATSCAKETSCENCINENIPPIAKAGADIVLDLPTDSVLLDGRNSSDADGTIASFQWSKISGPVSSIIRTPDSPQTIIAALTQGVYSFVLKVTDDKGLSDIDTVQVLVNDPALPNRPPVADAGPDIQIVLPTNAAYLNGSNSSDPDNNIVSYLWTKISGPQAYTISNANTVQTGVTNLAEGVYLFELTVIDAGGLVDKDTMKVTIAPSNPPPVSCGSLCTSSSSSCSLYWVCCNIPGVQSISYTCHRNFYQAYGAPVSGQNKVYFAGGHDEFWTYGGSLPGGIEYDPVNHSSRCFTLSVPRSHLAGATAGNKVLFAGGVEVSGYTSNPAYNTVDIYDELTLAHSVANLSEARSHIASVSSDTRAYFIGGKKDNGFSARMDIYNSTTNTWEVINLPRERGYTSAALVGNRIYIAGGKNNSGSIRIVDIYDTQSGQWTSAEAPHEHPIASVAVVNNKLIIAGGDGLNNRYADIYNTITEQWSSVTLTDSRFNMAVGVANNKVLFLGGARSLSGVKFFNESGAIDIYDDNTGNWSAGTVSPAVSGVMAASSGMKVIFTGFMWNNATTITNTMTIVVP